MATRTVGAVGADYVTLQAAIDASSAGDRIEIIGPPLVGDDHTANVTVNDLTFFGEQDQYVRLTLAPATSIATLTLEGNAFEVTGNENPTSITSTAVVLNTTPGTGQLTVLGGELDSFLGSPADDVFIGRNGNDGFFPASGNDASDFGVSTASDFENRGPSEYAFDGLGTGIDTFFNFDIDADHTLDGVMTNLPDGTRNAPDVVHDGGGDQIILYGQDRQIFDLVANGVIPGASIRFHIGQVEGSGGSAAWDSAFASHLTATGYTNPTGANTDWDVVIEIDYTGLGFPPGANVTILHDAIAASDTAALDGILEAVGAPGSFDDAAANNGLQQLTTAQANAFIDYLGDSLAFYFRVDPSLVGHVDGTYAPNLPFQTFTTLQTAVNGATPPGFFSAVPSTGDWFTILAGDYSADGSVVIDAQNHVAVGREALNFLIGEDATGVKLVLADDNVGTAAVNDAVQEVNLFGFGDATVVGNAAANFINGEYGHGDYTISGLGGNDIITTESSLGSHTLEGGDGDDMITGGHGADVINGGADNDTLSGGDGNDRITGDGGNDTIRGDAGDDDLFGGEGANLINGGTGNDVIFGAIGDDLLRGGSGADVLAGFAGNDAIDLGDIAPPNPIDPVYGVDANRGFTDSVLWGLGSGIDTVFNFDIDSDGTLNDIYGAIADGTRGPADGNIDGLSDNLALTGVDRAFFNNALASGLFKIHVGQSGGGANPWDPAVLQHLLSAGYANPIGVGEAWDIVIEFAWNGLFGPGVTNGALILHDVIAAPDQAAWNTLLDGGADTFNEVGANTGLVTLNAVQAAAAAARFGNSLGFLVAVDPASVLPEGAISNVGIATFTTLAAALVGQPAGLSASPGAGDTISFSAGDYSGLGTQQVTINQLVLSVGEASTGLSFVLADDDVSTPAPADPVQSVYLAGRGDAVVTGNAADNILSGQFGAGNDTLNGLAGNDTLIGGAGNDVLNGGSGSLDTAVYALSSDKYLVSFNSGTGQYTVIARAGNEGTDTLTGIEQLAFGGGTEVGNINSFVDSDARSDFDGDGDDDILFQFPGGAKILGNVGEANVFIGGADRTARLVGDFDGDNDTDILMELNANGAYILERAGEGNLYLGQSDRTARAVGDFDGDGDDDILFTLDVNGGHILGNIGEANIYVGRTDRTAQAVGDFDGDGDDDILMKLTAGGAHLIEKIGEANVFIGGADRTARAVGDFDGDGDDDILMQLNGSGAYLIEKAGQANVYVGATDRTARAVGDFDGDGDDDILMQLNGSGAYVIEKIGEANTYLGATDRTARAVGDFDGDGDDDILMELDANGGHVVEKIGEANVYIAQTDRDAVDLGLTDLGLAFEVV